MKIILTGGTGFIGSHFLSKALLDGHQILALRRPTSRISQNILSLKVNWLISQFSEVNSSSFAGYDVLVHFATHTGNVPYDNIYNCLSANVLSVIHLFEEARLAGIKRFIVAGSCFEYGRSGQLYDEIPSDAPLLPTNSYAASKAAASISLKQWADEHKVSLEILRIFHVYGNGEPINRFWPSLRSAALTGSDFPMTYGEQIRDFQPVESVANLFLQRALISQPSNYCSNIFNIGTSKPCSLIDFAEYWWSKFEAKGSLLPGLISYRDCEVMKYIPKVDLKI